MAAAGESLSTSTTSQRTPDLRTASSMPVSIRRDSSLTCFVSCPPDFGRDHATGLAESDGGNELADVNTDHGAVPQRRKLDACRYRLAGELRTVGCNQDLLVHVPLLSWHRTAAVAIARRWRRIGGPPDFVMTEVKFHDASPRRIARALDHGQGLQTQGD